MFFIIFEEIFILIGIRVFVQYIKECIRFKKTSLFMQYLILLYYVLYSIDVGFPEMDKQIRWETKI
jgi:hypothetical protein